MRVYCNTDKMKMNVAFYQSFVSLPRTFGEYCMHLWIPKPLFTNSKQKFARKVCGLAHSARALACTKAYACNRRPFNAYPVNESTNDAMEYTKIDKKYMTSMGKYRVQTCLVLLVVLLVLPSRQGTSLSQQTARHYYLS